MTPYGFIMFYMEYSKNLSQSIHTFGHAQRDKSIICYLVRKYETLSKWQAKEIIKKHLLV